MKICLTLIFLAVLGLSHAQVISKNEQDATAPVKNTIDNQFESILTESNRYQDFKVVKITKLEQLKENTARHINGLNTEISTLNDHIVRQNASIASLEDQLESTQSNLASVTAEKESISLLGLPLEKVTYNTLVWVMIASLLIALGFFVLQLKNSNVQTQLAKDNLNVAEDELERVRRQALEKEQKLGRMLQDERNKLTRIKQV